MNIEEAPKVTQKKNGQKCIDKIFCLTEGFIDVETDVSNLKGVVGNYVEREGSYKMS